MERSEVKKCCFDGLLLRLFDMFNLLRLQLRLQPRTLHLQRLVPMQGQHVEGRRHQNITKVTTQKHLIMSFSYDAMVGGTSNGYQNNALQRLYFPSNNSACMPS